MNLPQNNTKNKNDGCLNMYILGYHAKRIEPVHVPGTYLGYALINTTEGMIEQKIIVPQGTKSVNTEFILDQIKHPLTPIRYDEHRAGDNILELGIGIAHPISKGFVLVTDHTSDAKFEGEILKEKKFTPAISPNIHFDSTTRQLRINKTTNKTLLNYFTRGQKTR